MKNVRKIAVAVSLFAVSAVAFAATHADCCGDIACCIRSAFGCC